ncbi:MAG: hypothetical protein LBG43_11205 [Treponema sp.]|jgi:hypothetical protein|nr:hypothetical protein [Treponema sp.]
MAYRGAYIHYPVKEAFMTMAMQSFGQSNGFSALTANELLFVNGGSGGGCGWDALTGVGTLDVSTTLIKGGVTGIKTGTVAGVITGLGLRLIGVAMVAMGADMADGNGLDKTQAVVNGVLGK